MIGGVVGGFLAESNDLFREFIDRDERWLVKHDTSALYGDYRAGRTEIDRHRVGYELFKRRDLQHMFGVANNYIPIVGTAAMKIGESAFSLGPAYFKNVNRLSSVLYN